jgi:peptidyl-prolyl cis-trans isomerase B (cyclophilin B)
LGSLVAFAVAAGTAGCGGKTQSSADSAGQEGSTGQDGKGNSAVTVGSGSAPVATDPAVARYQQSFQDATREIPPRSSEEPPRQTIAGKSVGVLYLAVQKIWDDVKLVQDGKLLLYRATLETDQGEIEIELHPDWAPNHVRSFIALARVGYYDQLTFDRRIAEQSADQNVPTLQLIEAGCPLGLGAPEFGSIGYWLKDEFNPELSHEEGTVGACHGFEPDSAACRFYICLSGGPTLNGRYTVFGQVTRGLDIAQKIFDQPHRIVENEVSGHNRFDKSPVISRVIVHPPVLDKPIPVAKMEEKSEQPIINAPAPDENTQP